MEAETARSRFRGEDVVRVERDVRRSVSGERPTLNDVGEEGGSRAVMVRQVPLILMLSPRWASVRMEAQEPIVREVPPPPPWVSSRWERERTAGLGVSLEGKVFEEGGGEGVGVGVHTADGFYYAGEHFGGWLGVRICGVYE